MKKKKIVALLLATSVIATSPALFTSPMMVFAEENEGTSGEQIEVNTETIATNTSTIVTNEGTVEENSQEGTITTNKGDVTMNLGSITTNQGYVYDNELSGNIETNSKEGTVEANFGDITDNYGKVNHNGQIMLPSGEIFSATITNNSGTVDSNRGSISNNTGTVNKNEGIGLYEDVRQDTSLNVSEATGNGIKYNNGVVTNNVGDILENQGTVNTNAGNILVNDSDGTVTTNKGEIHQNHGTVTENNGFVDANKQGATIEKNNTSITHNYGTVKENAQIETENGISLGVITNNYNTVDVNNGKVISNEGTININKESVTYNTGTILENDCYVGTNHDNAKVIINNINDNNGLVSENRGTVEIIINEGKTDDEIDAIAKNKAPKNSGEVIIKNSEDEVITTYYGISGYTGLTGDDYYRAYLDSVRENNTYILSIPSGYGVDGTITLSQSLNANFEVIGDALETNENGDYIVPIGTQFKITGRLEFIGKWYKILQSSGAIVEVVQDTSSNDDTPTQPTPVVKDFTTSVAGVEINSWEDVSTVMTTKADTIITEPNSDVKLFKLELSKKQLTIPTNVVSNVATSKVDGLHCFIGDGDAITFIDNGTLENYIPTDFTHTDKTTDDMKFINFTKPQAIGATVLLSTRVPVKNTPVAIWMLVDGKYELVGFDVSNETGNIAFPISSTGQFVLTY